MFDEKFRLKGSYVFREIAGEFIAVPVSGCSNNAGMLVLNPVSALIMQALQSEHTLCELADKITAEFDVSRDEAEQDIAAFINELRALELLA